MGDKLKKEYQVRCSFEHRSRDFQHHDRTRHRLMPSIGGTRIERKVLRELHANVTVNHRSETMEEVMNDSSTTSRVTIAECDWEFGNYERLFRRYESRSRIRWRRTQRSF